MQSINVGSNAYGEFKFKRSTWYDYLNDYMVPSISDRIVYNSPVTEIDSSGARIRVTTAGNDVYEADRVIVTVPTTILQQ